MASSVPSFLLSLRNVCCLRCVKHRREECLQILSDLHRCTLRHLELIESEVLINLQSLTPVTECVLRVWTAIYFVVCIQIQAEPEDDSAVFESSFLRPMMRFLMVVNLHLLHLEQ